MSALEGVTDRELEELVAECDRSLEAFCRVFFPDTFYKQFSPAIHGPIFDILDDDSIQLAAIAAPRGVGKSTICNTIFPLKRIVYRDSNYIIPVSATENAAVEQAADVKDQLLENELLRAVFGSMEPTERHDQFGQREWVTSTGCKMMPRGAGQQVRGRKFRGNRPDLIIVDDLENDENVENEELRLKLKRWFFSALLNSVDRGRSDWRVIVIGTILHEDSLLNNLLDKERYPDWRTVRLELCDDNYKSNWPEHLPDEKVRELADSYRRDEMLDVFYREFRNIPIATEQQGFKDKFFLHYREEDVKLNEDPRVETVILADPARTMKTGSAHTAVVAVGIDTVGGKLYVRDIEEGAMSPPMLYDAMFDMAQKYNALVLAPEVTGLNEYITYPLQNEMLRRGRHYILIEVKPREGKTGPRRSAGLIPLYRDGLVYHEERCAGKLERYLKQWPRPSYWDVIDALAGVIFVMEEGDRYFVSADSPDEIEQEYEDISNEPALDLEMVI